MTKDDLSKADSFIEKFQALLDENKIHGFVLLYHPINSTVQEIGSFGFASGCEAVGALTQAQILIANSNMGLLTKGVSH
jgi:hypothetical protein